MAWLFISHSGEDEAIASRVRDFLAAEGYGAIFLDFDAESGLRVGQEWEPQLWSELRRADAVLFLDSAASRRSKWCFAELAVARAIGLTIIPLIVGEESQDGLIGAIQGVNLSEGFDGLAAKLRRALREVDPADSFGWDRTRAPYPGLQAFEPEDAAVFFGREDEVKELERRLHPTLVHGARRLLVLVGPSGSGKSSLVRAGLIPRLDGRSGWLVLPPMEPGPRPVSRLAGLLARALRERDGREIERRLRSGADALLELGYELSERAGAEARSVLLVGRSGGGAGDGRGCRGGGGVCQSAARGSGGRKPILGHRAGRGTPSGPWHCSVRAGWRACATRSSYGRWVGGDCSGSCRSRPDLRAWRSTPRWLRGWSMKP
jgi:hypothetical protein